MRIALGLAVTALVALALYAFLDPGPDRRTPAPPEPAERPEPEPPPPEAADLATEVAAWVKQGAAAVPDLVALLRSGDDGPGGGTWELADGRLVSFPTKRAAMLTALGRINDPASTAALIEALGSTRSTGETFLIARALAARAVTGWAPAALDRMRGDTLPAEAHLERELIAVVARADPGTMARRIEDMAPRGEGGRNPTLARGLTHLPWDAAREAGTRLLEDATVIAKAKRRYAEALLERPEPDAVDLVRTTCAGLSERERTRLAKAAVGAPSYGADAHAFDLARKAGDDAAAERARQRIAARVAACRKLLDALGASRQGAALDKHLGRVGLK